MANQLHTLNVVVSVAQVFALFIAVLTQDDLTTTLYLCSVGYEPEQVPPAASRAKWILSIVIRFMLGLSIIFLCFVFIVQSTGVIDLFKDFAAIVFVADIDDAAFALAQRGFLSDALREATCALEDVHFTERDDTVAIQAGKGIPRSCSWLMRWRMRGRSVLLLVVFGVLVGIWGWLYKRQLNGDFITRSIQIRFGDETYKEFQYAYFSGMYELAKDERVGRRPVYYERGETSNKASGKIFYCTAEEAWVFTIANVTTDKDRNDDCRWLLRSPTTSEYDFAAVPSTGWKVWTGRVQAANDFQLADAACEDASDCNYHGSCESDGHCECNPGWLGIYCGFEDLLCDTLVFYIQDEPIQTFDLLLDGNDEPIMVYNRPVYYGPDPDEDEEGFIVILYTGRRWFITKWDNEFTVDELRSLLSKPFFHAQWSGLYEKNTLEFSVPTDSFLPVGGQVQWDSIASSRAKGDFGTLGFWKHVEFAMLHCQRVDCSVPLVCGTHGECQSGTCICNEGYTGHFCEFPFSPDIADKIVDTEL